MPRHILRQQLHQTTSTIATTSIQLNAEKEKSERSSNDSNKDSKEEVEYEWDGVVIEGAHDADFEVNDPTDNFMPSMTLLSMANSVESPVMTAAQTGSFDSIANAGKIHQIAMENEDELNEDNLLEIGGDPDFLDLIAEDNKIGDNDEDESGFFWDGEVDEDAHLD